MRSFITRQSRRLPGSAPVLFAIIACSFLLLSSVAFNPASARQETSSTEVAAPVETETPDQDVTPEATEPVATETPEEPEMFWLVINKFDCNDPATAPYGSTNLADYQAACPNPMEAQFEAHNDYGYYDLQVGSSVTFEAPTEFTMVSEMIPNGYISPAIFCDYGSGYVFENDTNTSVMLIGKGGDTITCSFFNRIMPVETEEEMTPEASPEATPEMPGYTDLYIYKYTCPAGYDMSAANADPLVGCANPTNGITFVLTDEDPATSDLQTNTGDSVDGAVYFGGLAAGNYTITETVPADIASVFVLDCENALDGMVRPTPFSTGSVLELPISGNEGTITCSWFNVPADPHGTLTVVKYSCTTEQFVSDIDCEILETGQGFDLLWWDGSAWDAVTYGITDANGQLSFTELESGQWWLEEHNQNWCHMESDQLSDDGNWLNVAAGEETVVKVYNCGAETSWSTPTKYPNTGVQPVAIRPAHA